MDAPIHTDHQAMSLVSYAQNAEDIILNRALCNVEKGFYIDVGAQHPIMDSVTKLFYERGWRGVNIDPVPQWFELLKKDRPHDINLRVAVGSAQGKERFFAIAGTGLSTSDPDLARQHKEAGYAANELDIEIRTLNSICEEYSIHTVHFLKIDVEGAEADVIRGFSFRQVRPWIVLVEAVAPVALRDGARSPMQTYQGWEEMLLAHDYQYAYNDGLNRYYVAKEHSELLELLSVQANPLDAFVRYEELQKHHRIIDLEDRVRQLTSATRHIELDRISKLETDNAQLIGRLSLLERDAVELQELRSRVVTLSEQNARVSEQNIHLLEQRAQSSEQHTQLSRELAELRREMHRLQEQRDQYLDLVERIRRSRSWRMTAPLRVLARRIRASGPEPFKPVEGHPAPKKSLSRRAIKRILLACVRFAQAHPRVHYRAQAVYRHIPRLQVHLSAFARKNLEPARAETMIFESKVSILDKEGTVPGNSLEAADIFRRMQRTIAHRESKE